MKGEVAGIGDHSVVDPCRVRHAGLDELREKMGSQLVATCREEKDRNVDPGKGSGKMKPSAGRCEQDERADPAIRFHTNRPPRSLLLVRPGDRPTAGERERGVAAHRMTKDSGAVA